MPKVSAEMSLGSPQVQSSWAHKEVPAAHRQRAELRRGTNSSHCSKAGAQMGQGASITGLVKPEPSRSAFQPTCSA